MDNTKPWEYAPPTDFSRMLPLSVASLKRRIQRPSYVPVDCTGERMPREDYLNGASCMASDGTILCSSSSTSPVLCSRISFMPTEARSESPLTQESEGSRVSTLDLDAMTVELIEGAPLQGKNHISDSLPDDFTIKTSYAHYSDIEKSDAPSKVTMVTRPTGVRQAYVKACRRLDIPVSQFLYKTLHLSCLNFQYHLLSEVQFKALAISLAKAVTVTSLNVNSTGLMDSSFQHLCHVFNDNWTITKFYAANNKLSGHSAAKMSEIIGKNSVLELLDMSGNAFKDADGVHFANIIQTSKLLQKLYISNNHLGNDAGGKIGRALSLNSTLEFCDLSWNEFRKDGAWQLTMQSGINDNLKELDLSWNGLGLEGCDGLSQFLQVNTTLKVLNVTSNRISQPALRLLTKGLVKNCTLERFMVGKNPITHKGVIEFLVKLKSLQLCKASPIPSLQLIDFSGILVGREVVQLESYVREGFPKLQFVMDSSSIDAALSHNHPKHEYTKLSKAQAQSLFIETLAKTGIEPEYVLPKHAKVMWQLDEVMELLTALSVPLTPATIKLMLKKNATDGVIVPSQILSGCDKRGGLKSCVQRAH